MTKAEKTKQHIIEQTASLFNIKGIAATSVSDIMKATKLAKGSLYVHFANKEELAYCAVDYNMKNLFNKTGAVTDKHQTAKDKFFALLDLLNDPVNHPIEGGCPILNFGTEADDTSAVIRGKVQLALKGFQQNISTILEKGISDGEFSKGWEVTEFTVKVMAMLEGGVLISRIYGRSDSMEVLINILKREIEEIALNAPFSNFL